MWLTICDFLKPSDRKSLAWTCRNLFLLLNAKAPFLTLNLKADELLDLVKLHQYSRTLLSANEVNWQGSPKDSRRRRSVNPFTFAGHSSRFIFTILSTSTTLRSLKLFRIEVGASHQKAIISVPTLRELILQESLFVPTNKTMPRTSITSLSFRKCSYLEAPMKHILNLLAGSLGTLDLDASPIFILSFMGAIRLPHLAHIRHVGVQWRVSDMQELPFQPPITTLFLGPEHARQTGGIPPGILPQLRELSAPCSVGEQLIPGRPVTQFRDTSLKKVSVAELDRTLAYFAKSTIGIRHLEICAELAVPSLFAALEKRVPRIKRFRLLTDSDRFRHNPDYAMTHKDDAGTGAAALEEVEIRFRAWADCHAPPFISSNNCHTIFGAVERACSALEAVTFTVVGKNERFEKDENDLPPQSIYKLCKTADGAWEERRWGTSISTQDAPHSCSPRCI